ncbi:hypothetical protein ROJ8625_03447 [Roseivivax jejudonensis]|uniref:YdhG-like domain-containing protein n=1 Tax=Roseivivax jejudonensis TaxID=1529041 RepID=A0A1X7A0S2_9RHOB|nr:DUF1801 domain-containing protein [Roseivivax jejudonensis]SLN67334.1 hypothetical protein ROJ8625_03447 [Roseivivax jejudonensis]
MAHLKTQATDASVDHLIASLTPEARRADAERLDRIFHDVTGYRPRVWGDAIIGYGRYSYTYASGRSGTYLATGFAPRKSAMSLYIMPGYAEFGDLLDRLGPHSRGKACLYIKRLDRIDEVALSELIRCGLADLSSRWEVTPG